MEERDLEMLEFMVTALLADYDIIGLIKYGNKDHTEYGPEARTIIRYLIENDFDIKLDILARKIQYIFEVWFDIQPDIVPCIMIAREIKLMI